MSPETRKALEESIAHWRRIVSGTPLKGETIDDNSCALCSLFLRPRENSFPCVGCPIFTATGRRYCKGTPYESVTQAYRVAFDRLDKDGGCTPRAPTILKSKEVREAAKPMLAFLLDLEATLLK
jgi:hypothetical protein